MKFFQKRVTGVIKDLLDSNIAIIGGGRFCKLFLQYLFDKSFIENTPNVLGVADINPSAEGLLLARQIGIFTTLDYTELYRLENLQVLIELTDDVYLWDVIKQNKPAEVELIDHVQARAIWSSIQLEKEKKSALNELGQQDNVSPQIVDLFNQFADRLAVVMKKRNVRYLEIEKGLIESERTLEQIIQGTTIPTFVINKDHIVTHWNKALERLSGKSADEIVGTNRQWAPFWDNERPTMADVILDQISDEEIRQLYGTKWRRSALIEGAYEAEFFFPNIGENGKWCWFTAAPIKSPDGNIIGAVETLWDKTEDRKAEQEKERHMRLLTDTARDLVKSERTMNQIIQGSTMPTFVLDQNHQVTHWNRALETLTGFSAEEMVGTDNQWQPFYVNQRPTMADVILDQINEPDIKKLYGTKWRKSALIADAYEAEGFFPGMGQNGKWCWFTAAPIQAPDGTIIGAIETMWDRTEDKKAEEERERHL